VDISRIERPRLVNQLQLAEHPGIIKVLDGTAVIPGGYEGLLAWQAGDPAKPASGIPDRCADPRPALGAKVRQLVDHYWEWFGSPQTELVYHHRLNGPKRLAALSSPEEIAAGKVAGKPMPYGYGSGIQDVALENGQMLFALCDAYDATGEAWIADAARRTCRGLRRVAVLSPEPGFVPRGPHPDGKSYYRDSSRDQHAALVEALWRFHSSRLAEDADRRFIAEELDKIARRMQRNEWAIRVEDNSRIAHVGFAWRQKTSIGATTLLSFLALVADATKSDHWRKQYEQFSREDGGIRWREFLSPAAAGRWPPMTLYSNQFVQSLAALHRAETDRNLKSQLRELMSRLARRAMTGDVFDVRVWRRLDWAGDWTDAETRSRLERFGLSLDRPATVMDLFAAFRPEDWTSDDRATRQVSGKLCFGLPTSAFHKALLSGDPELVARVAPSVRRMVETMTEHGGRYESGENFNRAVVLGLLLLAAESREKRLR
jgi:hypothetical protein